MSKSYFKLAWRNITRNKGYSILTILGLAAGMSVAMLIGLWCYYQYSYDKFLPDYQQLYRVQRNFNSNGDTLTFPSTSLKLANALRSQVPEIEYVAESDWMGPQGLMVGNKKFFMKGTQIGGDFLKMFQYPLLQGNANTVLKDIYSIVLTQSAARALFGNEDPIGKTVRFGNKNDLKVTGILKDLPGNSSFQFNFLVPFSYYEQTETWVKQARTENFSWNDFQQFVRLKNGVSCEQVASKIKDIEKTESDNPNAINSDVILQPLKNWHLYSTYENGKETGGFILYVRIFGLIGALVLLIACINFINLTTARSEKRAKEVGVRKVIGSHRSFLVIQFLTESFLLVIIAFLFSLLFVQLAIPAFNALTGDRIRIPFSSLLFWLVIFVSIVVTTLIAGGRPAFYFSGFNPAKVLKGNMRTGKAPSLSRKILVVIQFSCSIALIISTMVIYRQIEYAKDRPVGYDIDRLMVTDLNSDLAHQYTPLKNELMQKGLTESVTAASSPATDIGWHSDIDNWPGKNAGETMQMATIQIAGDYFKTLGIPMKSGRDFSAPSDTANVIFNEAAIKRLHLKQPLDQIITWQDHPRRIVGVVSDALMISPFQAAEPTMFLYYPFYENYILYRLSSNIKTQEAIEKLTAVFNKFNPAFPFTYQFTDQRYAAKFDLEVLTGKLAGIFAGLAVFISCLGLYGLSAYSAEQRTKEIGIRKVLGASASQIWILLSKDSIVLILISCFVASPVALYFLTGWLYKYDYRINIGPGVFVTAATMAIVIMLFAISFQAINAALVNPVKSQRTE